MNSKFLIFNVKMKTMALLEENIEKYFHILVIGFSKEETRAKKQRKQTNKRNPITIKKNIEKLDFTKTKNFYH